MSLVRASDGLPARETGPWAVEKLTLLDRYSAIVTTAMKRKFTAGLSFIDLMAGPGVCVDTRSKPSQEFPGSTLIALNTRHAFDRILAIEADPTCVAALRQRIGDEPRRETATILQLDCNSREAIAAIQRATLGALTLMFVDLLGTDVHMRTLRTVTRDRSVDLVITWPEMDLVRNRGLVIDQQDRWNAFFGDDRWQHQATGLGPARRLRALQHFYLQQLASFGYRYTLFAAAVRNTRGGTLYRPLFASRHPLGLNFWQKVTPTPPQGGLPFDA